MTADVLAIMKVISLLAHAQDDRDPVKYRAVFADAFEVRLPMMPGDAPRTVAFDDFIAGVVNGARVYCHVTHHQYFNHVIDVDGDEATCDVDFNVVHQAYPDDDGTISTWTIGGRHEVGLRRIDGRWRITARTLEYRYHTGTPLPYATEWTWAEGQRRIAAHDEA